MVLNSSKTFMTSTSIYIQYTNYTLKFETFDVEANHSLILIILIYKYTYKKKMLTEITWKKKKVKLKKKID